jgi:hypothetical protein
VDLAGAPSAELGAAVEQDFHKTEHAGVLDLDGGFVMHLVQLRLRFHPDPV